MKTKVALVTGASSGIGEATALRLKALGYTVYAAARRLDRMAALAEAGIHTMKMDVTEEASVVEGVQRVITESGRIDVPATTRAMVRTALLRMCRFRRRSISSRSTYSDWHD